MNARRAERRRAIRATLPNPILWVWHGSACLGFLATYATNQVRRRLARDVHAVGKAHPAWLPRWSEASPLLSVAPDAVTLPPYAPADMSLWPRRRGTASGPPEDLETYFATHRWVGCLEALGGTDAEVEGAVRQAARWWQTAPARVDPAWEPYSAAERVANLVVLLAARPSARRYIDARDLRAFLEVSERWISGHLEYYGPRRTNNHILNDARALIIAGAVLENPSAVLQGLELFGRMGRELFQAGGFLRERSAHYHVVVANWLLDAVHFGRFAAQSMVGARAPLEGLEELASRALSAVTALGSWATGDCLIGDISPDAPPDLSLARLRRLYGASLPRSPAPSAGRQIDDWVFLGDRDQKVAACTIHGRFPVAVPTHGHNDVTHFVWRHKDVSVLVDAGRARYTKDDVSLAQSGAEGHNVLLIDGMGPLAESLVDGGLWHLTPYSNALITTRVEGRSLAVSHDGFRRLGRLGTATRLVRLTDEGLIVEDRLEGKGTVTVDRLWHFAPSLRPVGASAVSGGGIVVTASSQTSTGSASDWLWETYPHSSVYGEVTTAPLLRIRSVAALPCTLTTTWSVAPCAA